MAEQKMYGLDERGNDLWEKITRDYLAGRLTNRPPRGERPLGGRSGLTAAIANGSVAPGASGNFYLADDTFAATTDATTATNDSGVTIPTGTKCILGKVRPLSGKRVIQAFMCADAP